MSKNSDFAMDDPGYHQPQCPVPAALARNKVAPCLCDRKHKRPPAEIALARLLERVTRLGGINGNPWCCEEVQQAARLLTGSPFDSSNQLEKIAQEGFE